MPTRFSPSAVGVKHSISRKLYAAANAGSNSTLQMNFYPDNCMRGGQLARCLEFIPKCVVGTRLNECWRYTPQDADTGLTGSGNVRTAAFALLGKFGNQKCLSASATLYVAKYAAGLASINSGYGDNLLISTANDNYSMGTRFDVAALTDPSTQAVADTEM
jgi:hypothetical protein